MSIGPQYTKMLLTNPGHALILIIGKHKKSQDQTGLGLIFVRQSK